MVQKKEFSQIILNWYQNFGRKTLPWQHDNNVYKIWLSEIMLQQTQVITVLPYFKRFIARFSNIYKLSQGTRNEVLHLWTGLGYYTRAHNLHKTAKIITTKYYGTFPKHFKDVYALPGIGRSTAGAILSLAFDQHYAILDGNVKRILTRCYKIEGWPGKKIVENQLWKLIEDLLPNQNPGKFNQAMMDLGSIVCTYRKPNCILCPLNTLCMSYIHQTWEQYPTKQFKKNFPKITTYFLLLQKNKYIWLEQRPTNSLWGGLFCFPQFNNKNDIINFIKNNNIPNDNVKELDTFYHTFSHYDLNIIPIKIKMNKIFSILNQDIGIWYNLLNPPLIGLSKPVSYLLNLLKKNLNQ
ncbi:Adenine DNA glycosylase [Candidatus Ecksteinia adelgidicola]|nr:Adenine DNA glycosylase [Candidatus Ecksteinia adelgidicola]